MSNEISKINDIGSFDSVLNKIYNAIESGIEQHGQNVIDGTLTLFQIQAVQEIFIAIVVFITLIIVNIKLFKISNRWYKKAKINYEHEPEAKYIPMGIVFVGSMIIFTILASPIFNLYNWIALFGHPEFKIAKSILENQGLM